MREPIAEGISRGQVMYILGIDPGISGGLAVVDSRDLSLRAWIRMPQHHLRKKRIVDARAVMKFMANYNGSRYGGGQEVTRDDVIGWVIIEAVHAMPRQGVSSSFSFGRSTGAVEALALAHFERVDWVSPRVWKQHFGLGSEKRASLDTATLLFGQHLKDFILADDGIAEAALIARWFIDVRLGK